METENISEYLSRLQEQGNEAMTPKSGAGSLSETEGLESGLEAFGLFGDGLKKEDPSQQESSLSSLFSQALGFSSAAAGMPEGTEAVQQTAPSLSAENIEAIADRILVSSPESGNTQVRIEISGDILPRTSVTIERTPEGMLNVSIVAEEANSFQTAVSSRNDLLERLQSLEKGGVNVEVSNGSPDEGDRDRRSRGYEEYDPERYGKA